MLKKRRKNLGGLGATFCKRAATDPEGMYCACMASAYQVLCCLNLPSFSSNMGVFISGRRYCVFRMINVLVCLEYG